MRATAVVSSFRVCSSAFLLLFLLHATQGAWLSNVSEELTRRFGDPFQPIKWFFQTRQSILNANGVGGSGGGSNLIERRQSSTPTTTPELIEEAGYPVEIHHVVTMDGYILELHRIPHGKNETERIKPNNGTTNSTDSESKPQKLPVLVMHGWTCSSINWLLNSENVAMPYKLADDGYDVWMGNFRGNKYSNSHVKYRNDQKEFWDFTFHELGMHDLPSMIDYILQETDESKLIYVGHSMGTTAFFVSMSMKPEYNDKINSMYALAPVAYFNHMRRRTRLISPLLRLERLSLDRAYHGELVPSAVLTAVKLFGGIFCSPESRTSGICDGFLQNEAHASTDDVDESLPVPMLFRHYPDSSSTKTLVHFTQEVKSGKFCQYDHGTWDNYRIYGKGKPPSYNLSNIRAPVAIYYAKADWLAAPEDTNFLAKQLPNVIENHRVQSESFSHLDFLCSTKSESLLYNRILHTMNEFNQ